MNQKPIISNVPNSVKRVNSLKEYLQTARELREEYIDHLVSKRCNFREYSEALKDIEIEIKDLTECLQVILN
jgi:predicted nuclease with TOPRIM domain